MDMNGYNQTVAVTEQLPADSSGIICTVSSPSGSDSSDQISLSASSSSRVEILRQTTTTNTRFAAMGSPGKNMQRMSMMAKVQRSSPANIMTVALVSPKKIPSGVETRQKTDLLFSQFQAQMSQMKSAMDAVQNEMLHHQIDRPTARSTTTTGGRGGRGATSQIPSAHSLAPLATTTTGRRGRGRGRGGKNLGGIDSYPQVTLLPGNIAPPPSTPPTSVMYQSQISGSNGLKMKIKKSPNHGKRGAHRGHKRKYKKRKGDDDDDDIEDLSDDDDIPLLPGSSGGSDLSADTPSGWGDQLPENLLFKIFSIVINKDGCVPFLVRATKVCRLWHKVGSRPDLWTSVDLSSPRIKDVYRSERNLAQLLENRFFHVKHLNLGGWSSAVTNATVDILVRRCSKSLESLFLSSCQKLTGSNLKNITDSCHALHKIDLSAISTTYNTKSAVAPLAIGDAAEKLGPRLTHLSLASNCLPSCPQIVTSLSEHCSSLQVLDLSNVTSPRRDTIIIRIELLQQGCPAMRILRLTNTEIALSETSLKDQAVSPGFPELEELSLAVDPKKFPGLMDSDLERIVKNSTKLRLLDVRGCTKISDSGLVRVPAWDLEHLYGGGCFVTKCSTDGLELIVRKWKHSFKDLDFSWTPNEDAINLAVKALAEIEDDQKGPPPLNKLDLCGSSVTFDSVKIALKACTSLVSLNLTSCRALPRGIKRNYPNAWDVATLREQIVRGKYDDNASDNL